MVDEPTGSSRKNKPVTHLKYDIELHNCPYNVYDSGDMSNAPNPRTRYEGYMPTTSDQDYQGLLPDITHPELYIPVTGNSTDDLGGCVFNAYNMFVNEYRGLDGSQSIAELREFPKLFDLWNRRKGLATNLTSGFLNYSFGWRPVISDLRAVAKELRRLPKSVRKKLKSKERLIVRHYKFRLKETVNDYSYLFDNAGSPYSWNGYHYEAKTEDKDRMVVVTIRAKVKPKLNGAGQGLLDSLGRLGLIPSLATVWSLTSYSFIIDWFFNIGGAIENLQGSLVRDVSDVKVCVSDLRTRVVSRYTKGVDGHSILRWKSKQRYYSRTPTTVPLLPPLTYPRREIQYVLLALVGLSSTSGGRNVLRFGDRVPGRLGRFIANTALNRRGGFFRYGR
jgi:hypothetical protein